MEINLTRSKFYNYKSLQNKKQNKTKKTKKKQIYFHIPFNIIT